MTGVGFREACLEKRLRELISICTSESHFYRCGTGSNYDWRAHHVSPIDTYNCLIVPNIYKLTVSDVKDTVASHKTENTSIVSILQTIINLLFVFLSTVGAADRIGRLRDATADAIEQRQLKGTRAGKGMFNKKPCKKQHCDPACPCCSKERMPEFVTAIEAFHGRRNKCKEKECCYQRQDDESSIISVTTPCSTNPLHPFYNTAFMSFDYTGTYFGCPVPGETCKICGDSVYNSVPIILTDEQAAACEAVVRSRIRDVDFCWSDEDGAMTRDC